MRKSGKAVALSVKMIFIAMFDMVPLIIINRVRQTVNVQHKIYKSNQMQLPFVKKM